MAPLKHRSGQRDSNPRSCFHAYKSVAPLKLCQPAPPPLCACAFPRLQKRGPIEAHTVLPVLGPIWRFPRLQKRGPIEASIGGWSPFTTLIGFHAYKSVAPLKRDRQYHLRLEQRRFHAYKSVAPLKLTFNALTNPLAVQFPRLQKRGPIEAVFASSSPRPHYRFPRLQKRGPIEAFWPWPAHASIAWFPRLQKRGPIEAKRGGK